MDLDLLRSAVGPRWPDAGFFFHPEIGSTNDEAARLAREHAPEATVVFADRQSAGRGRRGARWHAAPGDDLLLSIVLRPRLPRRRWSRITLACGLAIRRAVLECSGLESSIKWPNDVLIDGRKIAGILMEAHGMRDAAAGDTGFAIVGVGLNVNSAPGDLPVEIRESTASLRTAGGGSPLARESVAASFLLAFLDLYAACADDDRFALLLQEIRRHSSLLGREVLVSIAGREFTGLARDLDSDGQLIVDTSDGGTIALSSVDRIRPIGPGASHDRQST
ncbi:MAG TPA: biotin--[acetyl-CoA-carboxylase] ligase [Longimicrobiaceae bacterium]|nr:biotin--[acetyl-CoA-carboxylase] ligase [Longimicrobiaceae bacterium]